MRRAIHFCFLLGVLPSLCGCEKAADGPTTVEGQVVVEANNRPLAGGQVQVWQQSGAGLSGGYTPTGDPHAADAQGRFSFALNAQPHTSYILRASRAPGYVTNWGHQLYLQNGRKNATLRLPVQAPAWIRLHLVDEGPKSQVRMFFSGFGGGGYTLTYPRDTSLVFSYQAETPAFLYWRITPDRLPEVTGQRLIALAPLDTMTVRVPF